MIRYYNSLEPAVRRILCPHINSASYGPYSGPHKPSTKHTSFDSTVSSTHRQTDNSKKHNSKDNKLSTARTTTEKPQSAPAPPTHHRAPPQVVTADTKHRSTSAPTQHDTQRTKKPMANNTQHMRKETTDKRHTQQARTKTTRTHKPVTTQKSVHQQQESAPQHEAISTAHNKSTTTEVKAAQEHATHKSPNCKTTVGLPVTPISHAIPAHKNSFSALQGDTGGPLDNDKSTATKRKTEGKQTTKSNNKVSTKKVYYCDNCHTVPLKEWPSIFAN